MEMGTVRGAIATRVLLSGWNTQATPPFTRWPAASSSPPPKKPKPITRNGGGEEEGKDFHEPL